MWLDQNLLEAKLLLGRPVVWEVWKRCSGNVGDSKQKKTWGLKWAVTTLRHLQLISKMIGYFIHNNFK